MASPEDLKLDLRGLNFEGRTTLRVSEVAAVLGVSDNQIVNYIESGDLGAVYIGARREKVAKRHWRIPIGEWLKFLNRRNSKTHTLP